MVRPRKRLWVYSEPNVTYFKPRGIPMRMLKEVALGVEEFEALRLKDMEGLEQAEIGRRMGVSQPTLHRLLGSARKKIAQALVNGFAIRIEGGNYTIKRRYLR
ncbi:hypothetical protein DRN67_01890 [Candidatus Micrarchaeota archaeon]|nr:MAG: hypothetical protein DRN67_01890 [Candidatus Micrarchaeota archaeon]